jgi:hypothetical protein
MRSTLLLRAAAAVPAVTCWFVPCTAASSSPQPKQITFNIAGAPARDAIRYVSTIAGLDLSPLWQDAEHDEGLDPDRTIDLGCTAATPSEVLERLIRALGPGVTWQIDEQGTIEIGPRSRLNEHARVVIYDVRDLLTETPDYTDTPTIDLQGALQPGSHSVFREEPTSSTKARHDRQERAEELINLISDSVEPDEWVRNGGRAATIRAYQDSLIVRAPGYIHRQIAGSIDAAAKARRAGR